MQQEKTTRQTNQPSGEETTGDMLKRSPDHGTSRMPDDDDYDDDDDDIEQCGRQKIHDNIDYSTV